jgi:alcohol dehydrogenase class IV
VTTPADYFSVNWGYPTAIRFGAGRIRELPRACEVAGITSPLFVTDQGLRDLPITRSAVDLLPGAGFFSEVKANPVDANVEAGVMAFRNGRHDGVVAFGGGSALDVGKCVAFMAGQTLPIWDFEDVGDHWKRADATAIAPIVAVPTTAGTGSEVGRAGVITNTETKTKKVIFHPKMLPAVVISDPELTLGVPPKITAGTGMDALAHCLEAYFAPIFHPMSEGIAVEGARLVKDALPRAVADGSDLEARAMLMAAASMGAVAFQKGLGAIHAVSHPVGALYDTPHGLTNAVFMPYVLAFNAPAIETKAARLAAWLGLAEQSLAGLIDWILGLRDAIGIPHTLAGLGITDDSRFQTMAAMAIVDPTAGGNPVPLDVDGALRIFRTAAEGRVG